jgi:hypothetical protein
MARIVVLLLLCAPLALAPVAAAQDDPFGPVPQAPAPQQPAPAPAPDPGDDGLGDTEQLLIGLAGIVLVAGIAYAILRDARRRAPETTTAPRPLDSEGRPVKGSRTPPDQRTKQNRAKAKVARQARKRNR